MDNNQFRNFQPGFGANNYVSRANRANATFSEFLIAQLQVHKCHHTAAITAPGKQTKPFLFEKST
jgi:hypothetical protein